MVEVVALTALGASASLLGVAISLGRTIRKILFKRKLVEKIAKQESADGTPAEELTPWERKEILRPVQQRSQQGRQEYLDELTRRVQQRGVEATKAAEQTRKWIEKVQRDNEELLEKARREREKARREIEELLNRGRKNRKVGS